MEAMFYTREGQRCHCRLCHHDCVISEDRLGWCGVRRNIGGTLYAESYGRITSLALDPIEKKPLNRFFPGRSILSAGSYGCNMNCAFCQNYAISKAKPRTVYLPPEQLTELATETPGSLGVAFTYNEPLISVEYILDTAPLLRERGMKTVLVTNGMIMPEPLAALLPHIDAMSIDLKAFSPEFYRRHGGELDTVKHSIARAARDCHVEVITLVIPKENDSDTEIDALAVWLASLSPDIPLHLSRFFPCRDMPDTPVTPLKTLHSLKSVAERSLRYVYIGNV